MQKMRKKPGRAVRVFRSLFLICGGLYLLGLLALYSAQRELIFAGSRMQGQPFAQVTAPSGTELVTLTTPGNRDRIQVLFGPALLPDGRTDPEASQRPTLLFFYGNGSCLENCLEEFDAFRRLGVNVLIPEYVGYGMSTGQASERGCYATADAAYAYLHKRPGIASHRIIASGWSLGGAVAIDLASRHRLAGLAVFSTFTSMSEMSHHQYPIFPEPLLRLLLKYPFTSEKKMPYVTCPVLIGHSHGDNTVPSAMSDRLARAAQGPVTRFSIDGADHGAFFAQGGPIVYPAVRRFVHTLSVP